MPWLQEWLQLLLAQLAAVASGEYIPLALRHGDCPPLLASMAAPTTMATSLAKHRMAMQLWLYIYNAPAIHLEWLHITTLLGNVDFQIPRGGAVSL